VKASKFAPVPFILIKTGRRTGAFVSIIQTHRRRATKENHTSKKTWNM